MYFDALQTFDKSNTPRVVDTKKRLFEINKHNQQRNDNEDLKMP